MIYVRLVAVMGLVGLAGCAGSMTPTQPTPASINQTIGALSVITADPVTAWQAGDYAVRTACHAYLNGAANQSVNLGLAGGGLGLGGVAAAGFLTSGGNPVGAAAATGIAALGQAFLNLFQASGSIPYTSETAMLIENALDAYEAQVDANPPQTVARAASYVDDLWWQCSPGGYAMNASRALSTATVSAVPAAAAQSFALGLSTGNRPRILINGN